MVRSIDMILKWHESFAGQTTGKLSAKVFSFGPCLWLLFSNGRSAFYAPDGYRTSQEVLLIDHMDKLAEKNNGLQESSRDR